MEVLIFLIFIIIIIIATNVKKVPPNTVIIIDRNSHYLKTKRYGHYWFNRSTDRITTEISTNPVIQNYTNIFKTHDDIYYELNYMVSYKAVDLEMVLSSLKDSHRSIYDVINCSVETVVATFSEKDILKGIMNNQEIFFKQLEAMLEPFYIDATSFRVLNYRKVTNDYGSAHKFNRHISSSENPVDGNYGDEDDPFRSL